MNLPFTKKPTKTIGFLDLSARDKKKVLKFAVSYAIEEQRKIMEKVRRLKQH